MMTVALVSTPSSMTAEQYRRVSAHLDAAGAGTPPGRRFHTCVGDGDQLTMIDVWDSVDELRTFTATLMPILAAEHIEMAAPQPVEVHRLVDDSDALRARITELRDTAFFIRPVAERWEQHDGVERRLPARRHQPAIAAPRTEVAHPLLGAAASA